MASYAPWLVVLVAAGGIAYNTTSMSIPVISDMADVPLAGIIMAVGLYGYFG